MMIINDGNINSYLKKLIRTEKFFESIVNTIREPLLILNKDKRVIMGNSSFYSSFDVGQTETEGVLLCDLGNGQWNILKLLDLLEKVINQGTTIEDYEIKHTFERIGEKIMLLNARMIVDKESNDEVLILLAIEDVTIRKQNEEMIKKQLKEKAILLKEVQHRVKNNINSIKSLLDLQYKKSSNYEAKKVINEAITRVESMYIVYEKLLVTDDYKELPINIYLEDLIRSILSIVPERNRLQIKTKIDSINIHIDQIFPLGAIVNELLTNSIKYAFDGRKSCIVEIILKQTDNTITLLVQDNGKGLPEKFNEFKGFGILLIEMLTEQLGGEFTIESNNGTKSVLIFNTKE